LKKYNKKETNGNSSKKKLSVLYINGFHLLLQNGRESNQVV